MTSEYFVICFSNLVPSPEVSVATPDSGLEGGSLTLTGTVTLPESVDIETTINATWMDDDGVVMNSSATTITVDQMDMNTYIVTLMISSLSIADNGRPYSLTVVHVVYPESQKDLQLIQPSDAIESNQVTITVIGMVFCFITNTYTFSLPIHYRHVVSYR